jgi:hypothetical protein
MKRVLFLGVVCLYGLNQANANVYVYTNQSAFNAVTTTTTVNFVGLAPANSFTDYPGTLTVGAVTFTNQGGIASEMAVVDPGFSGGYNLGTGPVLGLFYGSAPQMTMRTSLLGSFTAVSEIVANWYAPSNATIVLDNGFTYNFVVNGSYVDNPNLNFIGFTSDGAAIAYVDFTSGTGINDFGANADGPLIGAVQYGAATPEPGFYGALALGLSGLFVSVRRRRSA